MTFIRLDLSHLQDILEILNAHAAFENFSRFGLNWTPAQIEHSLKTPYSFGLKTEGSLLAFILGRRVDDSTYEVDMTMTDPKALKRGYMEMLFAQIFKTLKGEGYHQVWLEVHAGNRPAVALYQKLGFVEKTRRPRYYPDGESAILMTYTL